MTMTITLESLTNHRSITLPLESVHQSISDVTIDVPVMYEQYLEQHGYKPRMFINTCRIHLTKGQWLDNFESIKEVEKHYPLEFIKWYSGMKEEPILKAFERWKNESC